MGLRRILVLLAAVILTVGALTLLPAPRTTLVARVTVAVPELSPSGMVPPEFALTLSVARSTPVALTSIDWLPVTAEPAPT